MGQARKWCASLPSTFHWPGLSLTTFPNYTKGWQMELGHVPSREKKTSLVTHVFIFTTHSIGF